MAPALDELDELLGRHLSLAKDGAERPWGQLAVQRHDHGQVVSTKLHVTASLADLGESDTDQGTDNARAAEDGTRWTHAESWKVVTTGFSNEAGST
jgi:hypothetical protein